LGALGANNLNSADDFDFVGTSDGTGKQRHQFSQTWLRGPAPQTDYLDNVNCRRQYPSAPAYFPETLIRTARYAEPARKAVTAATGANALNRTGRRDKPPQKPNEQAKTRHRRIR